MYERKKPTQIISFVPPPLPLTNKRLNALKHTLAPRLFKVYSKFVISLTRFGFFFVFFLLQGYKESKKYIAAQGKVTPTQCARIVDGADRQ